MPLTRARKDGLALVALLVPLFVALATPNLAAFGPQAPLSGRSASRVLEAGGIRRSYVVHAPARFPGGGPTGLVLVLHGGGGTGRQVERHTGFSRQADQMGFVVAYPDAVDRNWNDGRAAPGIAAHARNIDDVGFLLAVIGALTREHGINARRVYVAGVSNGAFMSQRLAVEASDQVAAIAAVIGGMAPQVRERFAPTTPVSVLLMNGTDDPLVPYRGGTVARGRGETISVSEIVRLWTAHDRCPGTPETAALPDTDPADGTRVRRTTYGPCAARTAVVLYTVDGGGHTWPGGLQYLPRAVIGRTSRDIEATQLIWEFFSTHPRL